MAETTSVPARRYLEALRDSTVPLYEVVDIVPGRSMSVRDLLQGGEPVRVEERRGSQAAALWDHLAARIRAEADEGYEAAPVTRAVAREVMVRTPLFPRILSPLWMVDAVARARAPGPELRITDDEAVLFCEVRFPPHRR